MRRDNPRRDRAKGFALHQSIWGEWERACFCLGWNWPIEECLVWGADAWIAAVPLPSSPDQAATFASPGANVAV